MITIVAERDKGWFGRNTDYRLYKQTTDAYGAELILVDSLARESINSPIIFVEDGDHLLDDWEHPEDATYIFGRSCQNLSLLFPDAPSVRIETPSNHPLFGHVAAGIVLEDWRRKWQYQ